jgi:hypothetical protein
MSFEQYTTCTPASSHSSMNQYIQASWQAIAATGIGVLLIAAVGEWWCLPIALVAGAAMWGCAYCHWWLEDRLVCLDGDQSAIGMLVATEPPSEKSGLDALDTDFSINLLLPPKPPGSDQATVEVSSPYGFLIKESDLTKNEGLPWSGESATDKGTGVKSAILHGEFEGGGMADFLLGNQIALGLATVGLILCLGGGFWGAVAGYVLMILALLASLLGALFGLGDEGSYEDVGLPSVETNDTNGVGADILGITGRWVYDSGHNNVGRGWNEIHPIKQAGKLATWGGDWGTLTINGTPVDVNVLIAEWPEKVGEGGSPLTVAGRDEPKNQWEVHPLIDGCDDGDDGDETPHPPLH